MRSLLRLRRYGQDRLVAALVVTGLGIFFAVTYVAVVLGGGVLVGQTASPNGVLSVVATVIVALAANPVANWLDAHLIRWVNEGRPSPYDVLSRFGASIGGQPDAEGVPGAIAQVLAEGTGVAWAQVWLVVDGQPALTATWPKDSPARTPAAEGQREHAVSLAGEQLGMLRIQERERHPLTPVEERMFAGLAAQAGPALHRVRLRRELSWRLEQLADRADELRVSRLRLVDAYDRARRELERDIHDGAQQHLVALTVNLGRASTIAATSPERSAGVLASQADAAADAIATLVDLSRGIYPPTLTEHGIGAALSAAVSGSPVPVVIADRLGGRRADADIEVAVYFCCLEAVQNALKHSGALQVTVEIEAGAEMLRFMVVDDGVGFEPSDSGDGGLQNMRDRIDSVGGSLSVQPRSAGGTQVSGAVPVMEPSGEST